MTRNIFKHTFATIVCTVLLLPNIHAQSTGQEINDCAGAAKDSAALVTADWNWIKVGKGAEFGQASIGMFGGVQCISIVRYPSGRFRTEITDAREELSGGTDAIAERVGATAAINGSYFNTRNLTPVTFLCIDGQIVSRTDKSELFRTDGIVAVERRNVRIFRCDTTEYRQYAKCFKAAVASGPLLIQNNEVQQFAHGGFFDNRHPRTAIGLSRDGKHVLMIVVDGRSAGNADGLTIPELAAVAKWLGLKDALNLDGGGSTTLWAKGKGIINHPSDNGKFDHEGCRKVPNIISIR